MLDLSAPTTKNTEDFLEDSCWKISTPKTMQLLAEVFGKTPCAKVNFRKCYFKGTMVICKLHPQRSQHVISYTSFECHVCQDLGCATFSCQAKHSRATAAFAAILFIHQPRGSSNQDDSYVTAQALPVGIHSLDYTPLRWSRTAELSPPPSASPQVTTDPSFRIAAKA